MINVQILDEVVFISHNVNILGKGKSPIIFPLVIGKYSGGNRYKTSHEIL